jgi:nucleotide-binding universal stress UspA family protein
MNFGRATLERAALKRDVAMKTQTVPTALEFKNALQFNNVLYATDFRHDAELALPSLARKYDSKLYVVNVVDVSPFSTPAPTNAMRAVEAQAIREAKEASLALAPSFDQLPHEMLICKGDVWKEISRVLEEKHVDLIVLGTHGRAGVTKIVLGSVAENIFRHALCPVLTVGPHIHREPDRFSHLHSILVPTDFSEESAAAISCAVSFALANQSRLYLLHVAPSAEMPEHSLKHVLRNLIPADADFAFAPKVFLDAGVPSQKILDLADELAVDLIVLGVKPPALFRGTSIHQTMATACKVVSGAGCPVMTVRAPV